MENVKPMRQTIREGHSIIRKKKNKNRSGLLPIRNQQKRAPSCAVLLGFIYERGFTPGRTMPHAPTCRLAVILVGIYSNQTSPRGITE